MKTSVQSIEMNAPKLVVAASILVGLAIALDGSVAKGINGVAGILWFVSAVFMVRVTSRTHGFAKVAAVTFAVALVLVLLVKPTDLVWAVIGFTAGGAIVAAVATEQRARTAMLLPAIWLPVHLLVAITRVIERAVRDLPARVRTDPPPTAALVPFAMTFAALAGGLIVAWMVERRDRPAVIEPTSSGSL